jgi:hypothetical protein
MSDLLDFDDDGEIVEPNTLVTILLPIAAIGATLLVRKIMDKGYEKVTGHEPPKASDPDQRTGKILLYAVATAAAVAVVNVAFDRMAAPKRVHSA